ncbi:FtsX-like permease family protein [Clostridium sp. Marseille-P299]|uniref:FtsX-like permease family protein n=1 Tax=Clostridium sp. Marseille-P299 TaxID=1805477 RepID=UPI0008368E1C|nr:FtsX-like permease family protein [Clostridium sp. Marseille-P299]
MLTKLAFKNVSKSLRDYAVYFITLAFGVCVFYMFNSIYAQQDLMSVTESTGEAMVALSEILSYISVFVAVILGFLIVYANNFFIKRRKKELAVYMTLGMGKRKISTILLLETSLIALAALAVGLLFGVIGSQFMSLFTAKLFEADMTEFKFVFAPDAALKSILYFGLIFIIVMIFNSFVISKFKLIDLLYASRKNETLKIKKTWFSIVLFIFAILCLGFAYYLILTNGMIYINSKFFTSILLGIVGTLLFFFSLATILTKLVQGNKSLYFKNLNIFILRQLSSKVNTNFISVSVVCIVLLLTIGIFSSGYSMQNVLSSDLKQSAAYNMSLFKFADSEGNDYKIYDLLPLEIQSSNDITEWKELNIYRGKLNEGSLDNVDLTSFNYLNDSARFITISDYNDLLKMQGEKEIPLDNNHYYIYSKNLFTDKMADQFISKNISLEYGNASLVPQKEIQTKNISNSEDSLLFIVPDDFVTNMKVDSTILNINCTNRESEISLTKLIEDTLKDTGSKDIGIAYTISKENVYESSITSKALISYLAIYLGIVFMITCAAILAIQQLSEATDNKARYDLLKKLGADKKMLNKALFTQIAIYFFLPLLLAIIHSIVGLTAANDVIKIMGQMDVASSVIATAFFVIVVYGTYFVITYVSSKNIINRE